MQNRKLGRSGIKVAPLGLGCMRLSSKGWRRLVFCIRDLNTVVM